MKEDSFSLHDVVGLFLFSGLVTVGADSILLGFATLMLGFEITEINRRLNRLLERDTRRSFGKGDGFPDPAPPESFL